MRVQLRIVSGSLRGRKLTCNHSTELRPTPQMVREALFSILGDAVPDRPFVDVFAGTGINGLEALSRGASSALFVERDFRLANDLEANARAFGVSKQVKSQRTDAYRWAEHWQAPAEPVNIFISPPFADLENRLDAMLGLIKALQERVAPASIIILQTEHHSHLERLPRFEDWERRRYGRNELLLWQKEEVRSEK
jgi:16S rRNA (guanine966-N2)-methyltransferase